MKIQPLGKRVLIRRAKHKTSQGGILLPDTATERPKQGEVIACGNDKELEVKLGDIVLFGSYSGVEVKGEDGDQELLILNEDEILAVIEE